jgi:hypothetical protein
MLPQRVRRQSAYNGKRSDRGTLPLNVLPDAGNGCRSAGDQDGFHALVMLHQQFELGTGANSGFQSISRIFLTGQGEDRLAGCDPSLSCAFTYDLLDRSFRAENRSNGERQVDGAGQLFFFSTRRAMYQNSSMDGGLSRRFLGGGAP